MNPIKKLFAFKRLKNAKKVKEVEKEIREEAAHRITLRKIKNMVDGEIFTRAAICLDGIVIYETSEDDATVCARLFDLRETYIKLMGNNPSIELK